MKGRDRKNFDRWGAVRHERCLYEGCRRCAACDVFHATPLPVSKRGMCSRHSKLPTGKGRRKWR